VRNHVHDRMASAGGNRGQEGGREAGHSMLQFLIVIQKHKIKNISRRDGVMTGRS
jgi:hypothetical protein